jgi:ferredoxin-NADP reductase
MIKGKEYMLPFIKKVPEAEQTYSFYFDTSETDFTFLPGQYIRITIPHEKPDDRGTSRFFTISSSPTHRGYITITSRTLQYSFKKALLNLKPGTKVKIFAPLGKFILDETDTTPKVFLAGGIGITPFHSMITYAAAKNLPLQLTLIASAATTQELIFYQELTSLSVQYPNSKIIYTITHPSQAKHPWHGEVGRISAAVLKKYIPTKNTSKYYIVGSQSFIEGMKALLQNMNISEENIFTEDFPGY